MAKFIVLVIDSFGVGAMPDTETVRPQDKGANTCLHILQNKPQLTLSNLEKLGIINCLEVLPLPNSMKPNPEACYGKAFLQHEGGDTFMGHQEIMGTLPLPPLRMPFAEVIDEVELALKKASHHVERKALDGLHYLWVDHAAAVGDNLEADLGQVYNITGNLNALTFEQVQEIGHIVRHCVKVGRVIAFGGLLESSSSIQLAAETKQGRYIGINAPKSGAYARGFQVVHLGYGVNSKTQVPAQLDKANIPTILVGKVADIVANPHGISYEKIVDTQTILDLTLKHIQQTDDCFICTNIQETDLAGHAQDVERYSDRLQVVDRNLATIMSALQQGDILVVMADHGNDPTIGHSKHTREKVPLLIYTPGILPAYLGERSTMADVGATVCDYFHATAPENGLSFLSFIHHHVHC